MPPVKTPPPAYSDISSTDDPGHQRYAESEAPTISSASDGGTFSDIDDDEARSESSEESLYEEEPLILERGLSKAEAANIIRGARKHGLAVDLSYCEHSIQISASAEAELEKVSTVGFEPSEKDLEKIRQEYDRKKAAREADLPHYDRDANTKWGGRGKALVKGTGAIAAAYTVIGLPLSYQLAKSAYGDLTGPHRPEFTDEIYSNAARGKAERGEKNHTATGPNSHKSKDWLYNTLEGINVHNYEPSDKDLQKLEQQCANRGMAVPIIYKDPALPENRPDIVNGQRYEYEGSSELQTVCEKANKKAEEVLGKKHTYSSPDKFEAALVDIDNEFVEDFNNAIPKALQQAKNKVKEGYIQEHAPDDLKELQEKYKKEESLKKAELKDQPGELTKELDQLKLDQQAELESLYKRTVFDEQDGIDNDPDIKWGQGFDQSAFNNALFAADYKFGKGGFHHINGDEKDKKKPPIKSTGRGVRFRDKPPKERDVKAFAKAAVASFSGNTGAVTLKGSEEYKRMASIELKVEAALKNKSFHIEGYVLTDDDKKEVQQRVKRARDEIKAKKESLSIETVDDKDVTPPVGVEPAQDLPGEEAQPEIKRGGRGRPISSSPKVDEPLSPSVAKRPPSVSERINAPKPPAPLKERDISANSNRIQDTPSPEREIKAPRRHSISGPPVPRRESAQELDSKPLNSLSESQRPQRPQSVASSGNLMETAAGYSMTKDDVSPSVAQALSRNKAELINIAPEDRASHKASTAVEIEEAKLGSRPSTPIPDKQVTEGERYFFKVKDVVTDGEQKGAIIELHGAQQRPDQMEKRRFFVPEAMGGTALVKGQVLGKEFAYNIDFVQSQKLNQGQKKGPGLGRSNSKRANS